MKKIEELMRLFNPVIGRKFFNFCKKIKNNKRNPNPSNLLQILVKEFVKHHSSYSIQFPNRFWLDIHFCIFSHTKDIYLSYNYKSISEKYFFEIYIVLFI